MLWPVRRPSCRTSPFGTNRSSRLGSQFGSRRRNPWPWEVNSRTPSMASAVGAGARGARGASGSRSRFRSRDDERLVGIVGAVLGTRERVRDEAEASLDVVSLQGPPEGDKRLPVGRYCGAGPVLRGRAPLCACACISRRVRERWSESSCRFLGWSSRSPVPYRKITTLIDAPTRSVPGRPGVSRTAPRFARLRERVRYPQSGFLLRLRETASPDRGVGWLLRYLGRGAPQVFSMLFSSILPENASPKPKVFERISRFSGR
jgi:hypothetical protein